MKSLHVCALTAAIWLAASPGRAQQTRDELEAVVAQFYPDAIDQDFLALDVFDPDQDVIVHKHCFDVLESDAQGVARTILAGYTNHYFGAVRVLTRTASGGFQVAAHTQDGFLMGTDCAATAIDVDRDGRMEGLVGWARRRNSADQIYRWQNGVLSNITPGSGTTPGNETAATIENASFYDVDGDNKLEIYSWEAGLPTDDPDEPQPAPNLFRLSGGSYVADRPVVAVAEFVRKDAAPTTQSVEVVRPAKAVGPFTVRISNGAGASATGTRVENAVESARVWFNGQEIAGPSDFGAQVSSIVRTVPAGAKNQLSVRLAGTPGGRLTILIEPASWEP